MITILVISVILFGLLIVRPKFVWFKPKRELYKKLKLRTWTITQKTNRVVAAVCNNNEFKIVLTFKCDTFHYSLIYLKDPSVVLVEYGMHNGFYNPLSLTIDPLADEYEAKNKKDQEPLISERLRQL